MNRDVFECNEHGDPIRTESGAFRRVRNWKEIARDRLGRQYNARVHGAEPTLDDKGYLVVQRRAESRSPLGAQTVLHDTVHLWERKRPGYHYRIVNDTPGRVQRLESAGYAVTEGGSGPVTHHVGAGIQAVLMEIPIEDYADAQKAKVERSKAGLTAAQPRSDAPGSYYGEGVSVSKGASALA